MRGNLTEIKEVCDIRRSIPACAGEPQTAMRAYQLKAVYPRVCGGTWSAAKPDCENRGLSPRVRGNLLAGSVAAVAWRSIPACAGEPGRTHAPRTTPWVYPRVCGGTGLPQDVTIPVEGLSPRVRGNLSFDRSKMRR